MASPPSFSWWASMAPEKRLPPPSWDTFSKAGAIRSSSPPPIPSAPLPWSNSSVGASASISPSSPEPTKPTLPRSAIRLTNAPSTRTTISSSATPPDDFTPAII
ncbi:UNVERIFIED_CONTAM: hypothetical protein GTU68_037587 [Idotea baltica]|nr:hypothetical protein [Idotea baltica]